MLEVRVHRDDDVVARLTAATQEEAEALVERWAELEGYHCVIEDLGELVEQADDLGVDVDEVLVDADEDAHGPLGETDE
jgi:hypothetical protein